MQSSGTPSKFQLPWANGAGPSYIRTIPVASQIGIQNGAASLTDGFVPLNFLPVGSGGVPPFGQDMNGILNQTTANLQWINAGGLFAYDSAFATAIGGYPAGCMLKSASTIGLFWLNTADNNTTNPESGGSNWTAFSNIHGFRIFTSSGTWTVPAGVYTMSIQAWGGGGGGGGSTSTQAGSGGGGGGYGYKQASVVPGQVLTITIGAGGGGGASGGSSGGSGGNTIVPGYINVSGGGGGSGGSLPVTSRPPGIGGSGVVTDFQFVGGTGGGWGPGTTNQIGGGGGAAPKGGLGGLSNNGTNGEGGQLPGGGGGAAGSGLSAAAGGNGASGMIIIWY